MIRQSAAVLEVLSCEKQALLIWRDAFLVVDLCLDLVNGVAELHVQGDGLAGPRLDKDLETTFAAGQAHEFHGFTQAEHRAAEAEWLCDEKEHRTQTLTRTNVRTRVRTHEINLTSAHNGTSAHNVR